MCGSVDRGSGITATRSILFHFSAWGSQHLRNVVFSWPAAFKLYRWRRSPPPDLLRGLPEVCIESDLWDFCCGMLCSYFSYAISGFFFWFILRRHCCTVSPKTVLCIFVFSLRSFRKSDASPSQKKLDKQRNGGGEYIYIIVRGSWWRERYPKNSSPVFCFDNLLMYFMMLLFLPAIRNIQSRW